MFKKSILIGVFLGLFIAQGFLNKTHALDGRQVAQGVECVTAFLRGTCSKVEYDLRHDDSASAHVKRALISAVRAMHGYLLYANHTDYSGNTTFIVAAADTLKIFYDLDAALAVDVEQNDAEQLPNQDQSFGDGVSELVSNNEKLNDLVTNAEIISRVLLPELERILAIALVFDSETKEIKTVRFIASELLLLTRLTQKYLNAAVDSKLRMVWGALIVLSFTHVVYQMQGTSLFGGNTYFAEWLDQRFPPPAPKVVYVPAPVPQSETAPAAAAATQTAAQASNSPEVPVQEPQPRFLRSFGKYRKMPYVSVREEVVDGKPHIWVEGLGTLANGAGETCTICSDHWGHDPILVMACKHVYHEACFERWRKQRNTCPLCRAPCECSMEYTVQSEAA